MKGFGPRYEILYSFKEKLPEENLKICVKLKEGILIGHFIGLNSENKNPIVRSERTGNEIQVSIKDYWGNYFQQWSL